MRTLSLGRGPKGGTLGSGTLVKFMSKFNSRLAMGSYFKDISFLGPYLTLNDYFKSPYTLFQFIALRALALISRALTSLFSVVYSMIAFKGRPFSPVGFHSTETSWSGLTVDPFCLGPSKPLRRKQIGGVRYQDWCFFASIS